MNYIVDPMFFYWAYVCENLSIVFCISGIAIGILVFTYCFVSSLELETVKLRIALPGVAAVIMCILLATFIPNKKTLIEMEVAKHVTYESIDTVVEATQNAADYILNGLKEAK